MSRYNRPIRRGDPSIGLEVNQIQPFWLVSKLIWSVDIARSRHAYRSRNDCNNIHIAARYANRERYLVEKRRNKIQSGRL
jgi:hypothetical protein